MVFEISSFYIILTYFKNMLFYCIHMAETFIRDEKKLVEVPKHKLLNHIM